MMMMRRRGRRQRRKVVVVVLVVLRQNPCDSQSTNSAHTWNDLLANIQAGLSWYLHPFWFQKYIDSGGFNPQWWSGLPSIKDFAHGLATRLGMVGIQTVYLW